MISCVMKKDTGYIAELSEVAFSWRVFSDSYVESIVNGRWVRFSEMLNPVDYLSDFYAGVGIQRSSICKAGASCAGTGFCDINEE